MKTKYLPLFYEWAETGVLPSGGLCFSLPEHDDLFMLFYPGKAKHNAYWGYDGKNRIVWEIVCDFDERVARQFTPLRQNIVLFLAAMNNEL
jgi:hypothetical protein